MYGFDNLELGYTGTIYNTTMFFNQPCSNSNLTEVLELAFEIEWTYNVTYFPVGAFAMTNPQNASECLLMIQNFVETNANVAMNSTIVLGSMFLQQYNTWWQTDYTTNKTTLLLQHASNNTLLSSYTSKTVWKQANGDPFFVQTYDVFPIEFMVDAEYNMMIGGLIGF